jgi:hypothetical protein
VTRLVIEGRRSDMTASGQIPASDLVQFSVLDRWCTQGPSVASLILSPGSRMLGELWEPGSGIRVETEEGEHVFSGPLTWRGVEQGPTDPPGVTLDFVSDIHILSDRLAWPNPSTDNIELQQGSGPNSGYDVRSGLAEDVMIGYVNANIGPGAPVSRRDSRLDLAASAERGLVAPHSARFPVLGELLTEIGTPSNLGFRVRQVEERLLFEVIEPVDRTELVIFDVATDTATRAGHGYGAHEVSHVVVAGQGEGGARSLYLVDTTESTDAELLWKRRIERFRDARHTDDPDELIQVGLDELAEGGRTAITAAFEPVESDRLRYGRDWRVGDRVRAVIGVDPSGELIEIEDILTEAQISYSSEGFRAVGTLGDPSGAARLPLLRRLPTRPRTTWQRRISRLERHH